MAYIVQSSFPAAALIRVGSVLYREALTWNKVTGGCSARSIITRSAYRSFVEIAIACPRKAISSKHLKKQKALGAQTYVKIMNGADGKPDRKNVRRAFGAP